MNLLDNGKDSLLKSVTYFNEIDSCSYEKEYKLKDVIISLHHAVETLFKYMIKEKNEFLLYSNSEEVFKNRVKNKFKSQNNIEIKTIQFIDAVHRVIVLYDLDIKKGDYNKLIMLNNIRNELTHYEREFTDNEVEHLVAILLPVLLKVYKENINDFDIWAKASGIYNDIKNITQNINLWSVEQYYKFEQKWSNAVENFNKLTENRTELSTIFKNRKNNIDYIACPLCKNKLFHAIGTYVINSEDIVYLGRCEVCKLDINRSDAEFITLNYNGYEDYCENNLYKIKNRIIEIIFDEIEKLNNDRLKHKLIETISLNKELFFDDIKIKLWYIVDDFCSLLAEQSFEKYSIYNDTMERIIEHENANISDNIIRHVRDIYSDKGKFNIFRKIAHIIDTIKFIDEEYVIEIIRYINSSYISFHNGMYLDFEGNDVEREITFTMEFNYNEIYEELIKYKEVMTS